MSTIRKSTVWVLLTITLYRVILDLSYYFLISPLWAYMGFEFRFNSVKLIESYFLLFIICALLPKSSQRLSNIMIWLLILLSYVPMLTLFALKDESRIFMYAVTGFWLIVFLLLRIMPTVSLPSLRQARIIRFSLFILITAVVFLMTYKYFGVSFNFDLKKAYDIRAKFAEMKVPFLFDYLFRWFAHVISPIFFATFITKRKWFYAGFVVVLQILLFSVTGYKISFFTLPFVLVLMWIITRKNSLAWMATGLAGIILLGMLSYWLVGDLQVSSLFNRRTVLVHPQLYFIYYDFFSSHEYVFLSYHRVFSFFLDYPYDLAPANLIGEAFLGDPKTAANTGLVGDAYMNFGFMGLGLWSILLAAILKLVDSCSKGKDLRVAIAAVAIPTMTLRGGALLTNILTGGLFLALLFLYLLPKKDKSGNMEKSAP